MKRSTTNSIKRSTTKAVKKALKFYLEKNKQKLADKIAIKACDFDIDINEECYNPNISAQKLIDKIIKSL